MKILFLSAYFYPEIVASSYLSDNRHDAFSKARFDMLVYTPMPSRGVDLITRNNYKKKKIEVLYDGRMIVRRFSLFREYKNPILRAFRYFVGSWCQFFYGLLARDVDVLFISSTPPIQGAMAAVIKKVRKIPLVYNLQDIFPDSLVGTGLAKKNGFLWKIGRVIEDFTYRNADKIIVISEDFKRNIMTKGVPENKIEVVYNWVDQDAVVNVPRKENLLFERYHLDRSKFYVTYCGNIGLTQNMDLLLEVAEELKMNSDIHFVLVGEGAYKKEVERKVSEKNLENITLLPFQPYEDISHVFSLGNVGLIISKPGVGENSVPSKTWSIMSAERPVIANFDENELKSIIETNNCGLFTRAGNKEEFKTAILKLYSDSKLALEMGQNGRRFVLDNLTKEIGTQKYVNVIKSFVK